MRLRTPRLLQVIKASNRRNHHQRRRFIDDTTGNDKPKQKKFVSVFCHAFCCRKPVDLASSGARKINNLLKELVVHRLGKTEYSFKKFLGISKHKIREGETKSQENQGRYHYILTRLSGMFRLKKRNNGSNSALCWRFSGLLRLKKSGFRLRKWRIGRTRGYIQIYSPKSIRRRMKMAKAKKEEEEIQLCKKRILMGEKCKPLNISGSLHYDKNGVLLPEMLAYE